jgi:hypothetical protein
MVEYDAEATEYREIERENRRDGRDRTKKVVKTAHDIDVHIEHEFPHGHVNLEAYCPTRAPDTVAENVQYDLPENIEVDTRTLETVVSGSTDGWIRQARRWVSERPSYDAIEALEMFAGWDECHGVDGALRKARNEDIDLSPITPDRVDA